jgi:galactonate dehydratase
MKITNIETFIVPPRWCFCKITTDAGIVGWGEPVVEGRAEAVVAVVETHKEYLIGKDPMLIEDHWNVSIAQLPPAFRVRSVNLVNVVGYASLRFL